MVSAETPAAAKFSIFIRLLRSQSVFDRDEKIAEAVFSIFIRLLRSQRGGTGADERSDRVLFSIFIRLLRSQSLKNFVLFSTQPARVFHFYSTSKKPKKLTATEWGSF